MSLITREVTIQAGQQFLGTEFSVAATKPGNVLRLKELDLQMGPESKTWIVRKVTKGGLQLALARSLDDTGAPAAATDTDVLIKGEDIEVILEPGDQVQIVTTGATSEMRAKIYYDEGGS